MLSTKGLKTSITVVSLLALFLSGCARRTAQKPVSVSKPAQASQTNDFQTLDYLEATGAARPLSDEAMKLTPYEWALKEIKENHLQALSDEEMSQIRGSPHLPRDYGIRIIMFRKPMRSQYQSVPQRP